MIIPSDVVKSLGGNPNMTGEMFSHAEETFEQLQSVKEKDYISDFACLAVKTLERYYKGLLVFAQDETSYRIPYDARTGKYLTDKTHDLKKLRDEITLNFPMVFPQVTRSETVAMGRTLSEYSKVYFSASYEAYVPYEVFKSIMTLCSKEREYISDFLSKEHPFEIPEEKTVF